LSNISSPAQSSTKKKGSAGDIATHRRVRAYTLRESQVLELLEAIEALPKYSKLDERYDLLLRGRDKASSLFGGSSSRGPARTSESRSATSTLPMTLFIEVRNYQ
jgi:hypothetical protein